MSKLLFLVSDPSCFCHSLSWWKYDMNDAKIMRGYDYGYNLCYMYEALTLFIIR